MVHILDIGFNVRPSNIYGGGGPGVGGSHSNVKGLTFSSKVDSLTSSLKGYITLKTFSSKL